MGRHIEHAVPWTIEHHKHLQLLDLQAWQVAGSTYLSLTGVYDLEHGTERLNLGSAIVNTPLLILPSVQQAAYGVFQEALRNWRELTHPKH